MFTSLTLIKITILMLSVVFQSLDIPSTPHEFILQWRKVSTTEARAEYLKKILASERSYEHITGMFKNELPFGLLGEFITAVSGHCSIFDSSTLRSFLLCLTETGRFSLSLTFLSSKEIDCLKSVITHLSDTGVCCAELRKLYQLNA